MSGQKVCYLGDTRFDGPAIYLAGIMTHYGIDYDYIPSDARPPEDFEERDVALYVLSDYPAANWTERQMRHIVDRVHAGAGLLMIGGWESFHGRIGEYHQSPLAEALPVVMGEGDDRVNYAQPCLIKKTGLHEILLGLPFDEPPGIGGRNRFQAKPGTETILTTQAFHVTKAACCGSDGCCGSGGFNFYPTDEEPLLVVGRYGAGRTAALATDVAPHWVGGFVDWGETRLCQTVGDDFIEVGLWYAQFFRNLLVWTGNLQ